MDLKTTLIHTARGEAGPVSSVNPPLMRASTIVYESQAAWEAQAARSRHERVLSYGAKGTSTNLELEKLLLALERGAARVWLLPTGLAALSALLLNYAEVGAHFLITDGIYGPVRQIARDFLARVGVEVEFLRADATDAAEKIKKNTKLILCESPGSILYELIDLPELCRIAHEHGVPVAIDNTYASGYLLNPIELGADISVIAATKYLGGHSDLTMGVVAVGAREAERFGSLPETLGLSTSPDDCFLVLRGVRSLAVRMAQHEKNADELVAFLQTRAEFERIYYPKLPSHPGFEIFKRDFKGANGLVTVEFRPDFDRAAVARFVDGLGLFSLGASWGGFESLAMISSPPRSVADLSRAGVFVRFHIGLEEPKDLIADLAQALDKLG